MDKEGVERYLDRRCPHDECGADFKVLFDDWRDKVPEEAAFCPKCGGRSRPDRFNSAAQQRHIVETAQAYAAEQLNQAFSRAARSTRPQRISAGLFDIKMSVSFKAGTRRLTVPPQADDALRQDLTCDACACCYSTIGAGYFCPACGHNSPLADFRRAIDISDHEYHDSLGRLANDQATCATGGLVRRDVLPYLSATGITLFRKNGGTIEAAQQIAAHESPRTTMLYDRTDDEITLDEIDRIVL